MTVGVLALLAGLGGIPHTALAAGGADGASVRIGGVDITPAIQVNEAHDDNVFAQEKTRKSSWITTIEPGVLVSAESGTSTYELRYQLSKGLFHSSRNDDFLDHFVSAKADFDMSSRLKSGLWVNYSKTHDRRGTTFTGAPLTFNTPDRYHRSVAGGKVSYGKNARIDLNAEYTNKRYDNHHTLTQTRDLDTIGGSAAFSYPVGPKTSAVVEARYKHYNYKFFSATTNLDSNEQRYFAGLDWEATAKTTGHARVGYLKKNFSDARLIGTSQFAWELGVLWEPMSYSSWELATDYKPLETDGTGTFSKSIGGRLTWKHEWNSKLSHSAYGGYRQNRFQGLVVQRKDKVTTAGASVDYQLMRWLGIGGAYDYTNRSSNAVNSSFRDNVWSVNIITTL